ncbi:MAG: S46 family peptidase, partial [Bacteroidales bacterium]|nr:S46 family peptidase [Bacteroidales bacterium]
MRRKSKMIYRKGKLFVLAGLLLIVSSITAKAELRTDEGMWLPMLVERLNYAEIQEKGLNLTPEELYNINNSSIKDAVAGLGAGSAPNGFFCTAEVVSPNGLLFTNHHCGYDAIQSHSSVEHDYLTEGFWAREYDEELPNEDMTATFLVRMDDVTEDVVSQLSDTLTAGERMGKIRKITSELEKEATEDGKYDVVVKSFYEGNEFYRFVYLTYKDVRLVGAPPESIGNYGGDTDNWMWPRHTGDFSIFRIYTAPDGSPAEYSEENVPLKAKNHLKISLDPKKKDDFAMIWGYPGGTDRYLTSYGVDFQLEETNPVLIKLLGAQLDVMEAAMDKSEKVRIMYASKEARLSNGYKYFKGQTKGLKDLNVKAEKEAIEEDFRQWINNDPQRKEKYGNVLSNIETAYKSMKDDIKPLYYASIAGMGGAEIISFASNFKQLKSLLEQDEPNEEAINKTIESIREKAQEHFKNYHAPTDQKLLSHMMELYYTNVRMDKQPEYFREVLIKEYKGDFEEYAEEVFDESIFVSQESVNKFLDKPKAKKVER